MRRRLKAGRDARSIKPQAARATQQHDASRTPKTRHPGSNPEARPATEDGRVQVAWKRAIVLERAPRLQTRVYRIYRVYECLPLLSSSRVDGRRFCRHTLSSFLPASTLRLPRKMVDASPLSTIPYYRDMSTLAQWFTDALSTLRWLSIGDCGGVLCQECLCSTRRCRSQQLS